MKYILIYTLALSCTLPAFAMDNDENDDFVIVEAPLSIRCKELQSTFNQQIERIEKQLARGIVNCFEPAEIDKEKQLYLNTAQHDLTVDKACYAQRVQELADMIIRLKPLETSTKESGLVALEMSFFQGGYDVFHNYEKLFGPARQKYHNLLLSETPITFEAFKAVMTEIQEENKKREAENKLLKADLGLE